MMNPKERRRSVRVPSDFPLRYRPIPVSSPAFFVGAVEDVSSGGVRFRCADDLRVRSSLLFELLIPGGNPVHTFGRVAWVRELPSSDGFEVGGSFEDQSTTARKAIDRHVRAEYPLVGC